MSITIHNIISDHADIWSGLELKHLKISNLTNAPRMENHMTNVKADGPQIEA